jgi:hypothetical protein
METVPMSVKDKTVVGHSTLDVADSACVSTCLTQVDRTKGSAWKGGLGNRGLTHRAAGW